MKKIQALKFSMAGAVFLALVKFAVALLTQSMAIMSSALDSLMDIGSSAVNYVALREGAKPPDEDHAYGHGKVESLAALFQSLFISVSGIFIVIESIRRLIVGSVLEVISMGIGVMIFSVAVSIVIVLVLKKASQDSHSPIMKAEKLHYAMDILTNIGVILALILSQTTGSSVWDLILSIVIASIIFNGSLKILRQSIDELLDKSLPIKALMKIERIILGHHSSIVGIHNLRSRQVGEKIFLDFHVEIRGEDEFKRAHSISDSLEKEIQKHYHSADVTIHCDPEGE